MSKSRTHNTFLDEIAIRNLGIIEESRCEFSPGFNVLTGETGAGKTMILTALSLILGGKSDSSLVRHGSDRLQSSAVFSVTNPSSSLTAVCDESDVAIEDGQLIISRSVTADGKSKAQINGAPAPAATVASITDLLVEIHGQSANHQIVKSAKQREILDTFGGKAITDALSEYQESYQKYRDLKERINAMKKASAARDSEIVELEEFVAAWKKLNPIENELTDLDASIARLSSVEVLRTAASTASEILSEEEAGVLTLLHSASRSLDGAKAQDKVLEKIADQLKDGLYQLDDAARELASYLANLEADPAQLQSSQERKAALNSLIKKFGSTSDDPLADLHTRAANSREALADLRGGDSRISELEAELSGVRKDLLSAARALTSVRKDAAIDLSNKVTTELAGLSMPHTVLSITVASIDYEGSLKESDFTTVGCDEVSIGIQAQKDGPIVAIGKGVSGGEMSRIMLALSVVIAGTYPLGTYIFDEVDAGVGGKAAIEVGRRLFELSKNSQVIVVTHLPQVACWADTHLKVAKTTDGHVVASGITSLDRDGRVEEIARMLAGLEESSSAREHALELLALRDSR